MPLFGRFTYKDNTNRRHYYNTCLCFLQIRPFFRGLSCPIGGLPKIDDRGRNTPIYHVQLRRPNS